MDASITTIFGMRGSGKSLLTREIAENHARRIVFDITGEWSGRGIQVFSYREFANVWRERFTQSQYTIILKFDFGMEESEMIETAAQVAELIYRTGKDSGLPTCLVIEEAHFYFPNHGLHRNFLHLLTTGRHGHVNMICNTQRPASVSKLLISQSEVMYVGSLYEENDIAYLRGTIGAWAEQARELPKLEFLYFPVGRPAEIAVVDLRPALQRLTGRRAPAETSRAPRVPESEADPGTPDPRNSLDNPTSE